MPPFLLLLAVTAFADPAASTLDAAAQARMACVNAPLTAGEAFELAGTVSVDPAKAGIVVSSGERAVTVLGVGPAQVWQAQAVARPANGDLVTVKGLVVDCGGETLHVARTIDIRGRTVALRREDGEPVWKTTASAATVAGG